MNDDRIDYYKKNTALCDWLHHKARNFRNVTLGEIRNEEYHREFAMALAWSSYTEGTDNLGKFMLTWELDDIDALCYLHEETGSYEVEVEQAFEKHLTEKRLSQYD